ncbi:ribbon-helix-helix protein, CopG family [Bradyrhizobium septentrionale]|uniref:Ribbon-helix-helix protein CopG domain-containing protein n=1 Tax=Bradyrhizobium septentrionale TaxID=1404411 RepID=A0A974A084_9BRAD|nr:ribbon-helix-helix protein, CopG family [Bradyrhizobium septentrionale]UGY12483.1 ribbon-helix-helix protein, CopG family [Bradyrhizobium septentrionale]
MRRKIVAALDDHDYEQLELLATLSRIKRPELLRRIIRAYLDKGNATLATERAK